MAGRERHAPRGTAGRGPQLELLAASGPRRSCTALREAALPAVGPTGTICPGCRLGATRRGITDLGTAGRGTRKRTTGHERAGGAGSELSHGCRRDAVTVCFRYLVPQFSEDSTIFSELALLHSESGVELCPRSIKADGEETRQSSYNPNRV